ncbi:MAG TPA: hypothetical protein VHX19_01210, partial [Stellaceae bacterium]|nr:hypothetical protein [Stellaceae bacterium]
AALQQRMTTLEAATRAASDKLASLQAESQKTAVGAPVAAAPSQQVDLGPLQQRITSIESQLQPLAANVANLQTQFQPLTSNVANLQTQIQPMVANVANLQSQLQPLAAAVAASKADVSASQDVVRKAVSASDAAALVVVAQSLVGALDRGASFASEVAAAQALGAGADRIGTLQPLAAKGVPTAEALADAFAPLAAPILTGSTQKEPKGLLDRLTRDASSLVRVRPVGAAAATGTDPASIVARIEGALAQGDIAGALSTWDQLPAAAKSVTGDWANAAKARVAADTAAHALLADAIDRLGRPKS